MSYITLQDLQTRYGADEISRLADRDGDSIPDADVIATAIGDAGEVVDSYLSSRFALPLAQVPVVIVRLACAITRYHLYDDKPSDHVTREYSGALQTLQKIADGDIRLGIDGAALDGATGEPDSATGTTRFDDLTGY